MSFTDQSLSVFPVASLQKCKMNCQFTANCVAFNFDENSGNCELKSEVSGNSYSENKTAGMLCSHKPQESPWDDPDSYLAHGKK